jgi:outer membrane receptor protein involved in Fe transport
VPERDLDVYLSMKNLLDRQYIADMSRGLLPGAPRQAMVGFTARW